MKRFFCAVLTAAMMFSAANLNAFSVSAEEPAETDTATTPEEAESQEQTVTEETEGRESAETEEVTESVSSTETETKEQTAVESEPVNPETADPVAENKEETDPAAEDGSEESEALMDGTSSEKIEYTVTLNGNGGTVLNDASNYVDSTSFLHVSGKQKAIKNKVSRFGYKFLGWSTDPKAEEAEYKAAVKYRNFSENGRDVTLYAVWQLVDYTLIQYGNGGTFAGMDKPVKSISTKYNAESDMSIFNLSISKPGFTFLGWAAKNGNPKGSKYYVIPNVNNIVNRAGSYKAIYAAWRPNTYTVTLNGNGGQVVNDASSFVSSASFTHTFGTKKAIKNRAARSGYKLLGWSEDPNAQKPTYKTGKSYKQFSSEGKDVVLYAVWQLQKCKLTQYSNGGVFEGDTRSKSSKVTTYTAESDLSVFNLNISKTGYHFAGWFVSKQAEYPLPESHYPFLIQYAGKYKTLYAKWTPKEYTVTLDANGGTFTGESGSSSTSSFRHTFSKKKAIKANVQRDGYTLVGWSLEKDAAKAGFKNTSSYKAFSSTGDDVKLYAVWKKKK